MSNILLYTLMNILFIILILLNFFTGQIIGYINYNNFFYFNVVQNLIKYLILNCKQLTK